MVLGLKDTRRTDVKLLNLTHEEVEAERQRTGKERVLTARTAKRQLHDALLPNRLFGDSGLIAQLKAQLREEPDTAQFREITQAIDALQTASRQTNRAIEAGVLVHRSQPGKNVTEFPEAIWRLHQHLLTLPANNSLHPLATAICNNLNTMKTAWDEAIIAERTQHGLAGIQ